ncbi:adenylate cyclase [Flavobacteriaceae bacterium UJ101]|nr:adenylate cyclase [Flavobacteriaceae bacterium UJ101]
MNIEIERKFLVSDDFRKFIQKSTPIKQGYLNTDPERTVRIRTKGNKAFITVKGKSSKDGLERFEWEKELSLQEAKILFPLCEKHCIEKIRHEILYENYLFEIDEFLGDNKGLILAEVELKDKNETIILPKWIIKEVTGNLNYYNSYISTNPFKNWNK